MMTVTAGHPRADVETSEKRKLVRQKGVLTSVFARTTRGRCESVDATRVLTEAGDIGRSF